MLESEGEEQPFVQKESEGHEGLAPPYAMAVMGLTGTSQAPDLMLAFADTSGTPVMDGQVQQALLAVPEESGIREESAYGGDVIFDPESFEEGWQIPAVLEDGALAARLLLLSQGEESESAGKIGKERGPWTKRAGATNLHRRQRPRQPAKT